jgi:hypothetical protein
MNKLLLAMTTLMLLLVLALGSVAPTFASQVEGPNIALQQMEVDSLFLLAEPIGGGSSGT